MNIRILIASVFYICLILGLLPLNTQANINYQLDFSETTDKYLFDLSNMKPGDWETRSLEIQNEIGRDFKYNTNVHFKGGSKKLYKEFKLKVWDSNRTELYTGNLHEFNGFNPRSLVTGNKEILTFEAKFPYELGNEFQGLGFEFELQFVIEGKTPSLGPNPNQESSPDPNTLPLNPNPNKGSSRPILNGELATLPVDGKIMPATATTTFNSMFLGVILLISGSALYILQRNRKCTE